MGLFRDARGPQPGIADAAGQTSSGRGRLRWGLAPGRRAAWRRSVMRRALSCVLAAGAVLGTVAVTRPAAPAAGRDVVVAARTLPTGWVLRAEDLEVVPWPPDLVPPRSSTDPRTLIGSVLVAPVVQGEAVSTARVGGAGLLAGQPSGTAAAYLPLQAAGVAAMLRPGDRVDVVGPSGAPLAEAVVVLAVLGAGSGASADSGLTNGTALVSPSSGSTDPGVVLAVPRDQAAAVAQAIDPQTGLAPAVVLSPIAAGPDATSPET